MAYYTSRSCYYDAYGRVRCRSAWNSWVRWLVFGLIVGGALLLFLLFSCLSARRRRKSGYRPYWGTGWAAQGHGQPTYNPNVQQQQPSSYNMNNNNNNGTAQPYYANTDPTQQSYYGNQNQPPPYAGDTNGANQSYYRGEGGVSEPAATYQGQYKPPAGPPPGR
ncbi:hypothetical protein CAC42_6827 [Sphaceloma murrayae]|uniref:Uncharacterized protein n=1 Tax=Sphaceloma murrayae TaxID=2082308 RepID=A0A2K1QGN3_9PEZI|nr:hypothetical protein CAC42_6827 [Sphaceloma murrayae]